MKNVSLLLLLILFISKASALSIKRYDMPASDSVLQNILKKYPNKAVFIDFWATWCSPCRQAITEMAPIKEALKGKDIVFVYITNHTSPENAYKTLAATIPGEHYQLDADTYEQLAARFNIRGIPHYVMVDRKGVVVEENFRWRDRLELKERLVELSEE